MLHASRFGPAAAGRLLLGGVLLLLSACAPRVLTPPAVPESVWLAHRDRVAALDNWQVQGRVAIHRENDGWNAAFDWRQTGETWRLRLRGPFGQGGAELYSDGSRVWLERSDREPVSAQDVDRLLAGETGWRLPVRGLRDWLRGIPAADRPAQFDWDTRGLLQALDQDGWHIEYGRYSQVGGFYLPDRLKLARDQLGVKLVVDTWQLP